MRITNNTIQIVYGRSTAHPFQLFFFRYSEILAKINVFYLLFATTVPVNVNIIPNSSFVLLHRCGRMLYVLGPRAETNSCCSSFFENEQ